MPEAKSKRNLSTSICPKMKYVCQDPRAYITSSSNVMTKQNPQRRAEKDICSCDRLSRSIARNRLEAVLSQRGERLVWRADIVTSYSMSLAARE